MIAPKRIKKKTVGRNHAPLQNIYKTDKENFMEELDLKELFNIFWRRKVAIIVILFIAIVIGVLYSYLGIKPQYTSYTTALIKQENIYSSNSEKANESNFTSYVPTYMELVKSKTVINVTIK